MIIQPTEQNYHLKCKIISKVINYKDHQSTGIRNMQEEMIFLMPLESTQRDMFYNAWLPDMEGEFYEIGLQAAHPIYGVFRACIRRATKEIQEPHIFVMSRFAEEVFKKLVGKTVDVKVLGENEDEQLDSQRDYELPSMKEYED